MFVLTGSAADKVCYEYGQGLLTYSILQFMKTLVTQGDRPVDVMNLFRNNKPLAAAPMDVEGSKDAAPDLVKKKRRRQCRRC